MGLYEDRVKRLHNHVMKQQKAAEQTPQKPESTIEEIKAKLEELGIEYNKRANKATLMALLEEVQNNDEPEVDPDDDEGAE